MASVVWQLGLFVGGLAVLLWASDTFTAAAQKVGLSFGVSPFVIGMTVVAIGTSLPELVSAVLAVRQGAPAIPIGNVVGSNVSNIFLVLGVAAVVGREVHVERDLMQVDLPLLAASAGFLVLATLTGPFTTVDGLLALVALAVYVHFTIAERDVSVPAVVEEVEGVRAEIEGPPIGLRTYGTLVVTLVLLFASASVVVGSVVDLAAAFGVGTEVVAVTVLAFGTVLPEIAVSTAAARRGDAAIAVGTVLGSNIANTFGVLGVASLVGPLSVPPTIRTFGVPAMVLATVLYLFVTQDRTITRWEGATLLVLYVGFVTNLVAAVQ